jgi:hypothetical protein
MNIGEKLPNLSGSECLFAVGFRPCSSPHEGDLSPGGDHFLRGNMIWMDRVSVPCMSEGKQMAFLRRIWLPLCWVLIWSVTGAIGTTQTSPQRASPSNFDGPAELPRVFVKSGLADTPAPGRVVLVKSGDNLQNAFDHASCGDTIKLESGASFVGHFRLPKKPCDDAHWIVIRTSAQDGALPAEGTRITPCYAGIASLPGRPAFRCASVKNEMARIASPGRGTIGPILFADGANHYRFIGLEVTRESSPASVIALASPEEQVAADHVIFDRVWMHGTAQDETRRGLFLSGTTYMAVVDSYFSDFHCVAKSGACTDSQAISGASGDLPMGPYKIVNNFLEAAGENIIFGGAKASTTPADIEIRHNYLFKPLIWMKGQPGFVGASDGNPFIVKNHFELKNAQRVLFEGNVMENSWGGFSQTGFSILLTPKNLFNSPIHHNLCPVCRVTDVTIRDCFIVHVGSGLQIANVMEKGGEPSAAGERYSIHDLVIDDIDGQKYGGFGAFLVLLSNQPTLKDVQIDHVTAVSSRVALNVGVKKAHIQNFVFTNNLVSGNEKGMTSTGGPDNCVVQPERQGPSGVFKDCFDSVTFTNNAIINGSGLWPPGNFFPKDVDAVGFVKHGEGWEAFRLCRTKSGSCKNSSKYINAGHDQKDIGADIDAVTSATQGVRE